MRVTRALSLVFLFLSGALAAGDDSPAVTLTKMTGHIYKINAVSGFDVNFVASVGADGILLVDTGFKETAAELGQALRALGSGEVKFVINTHGHVDHTGGNRAFGRSAVVISHAAMRDKIRSGRYLVEENPPWVLPDITFEDEFTIYFNGEEIRVTAVPGSHDNDDLMVHFTQSKIVYMGDLAYGLNYPSYDTRTGDATRYAEMVGKALRDLPDDVTVVSGHGRDCSIPEMREFQSMLAETTETVLAQLAEGKKASDISPESLGKWSGYAGDYQSADQWIRSLADSVEQRGKPHVEVIAPMYLARREGGIDAAIGVFERILAENPGDYHLNLYLFGKYLNEQRAWGEAARIFGLANSAFPENPYVWLFWYLQGDAHLAAGEREAAARAFRASLALNPAYGKAREKLALLQADGAKPGGSAN